MVMKISQPLAESMELKKSLMEDVLKVYGDAAAYGVAEVTTAATFRLGEVYQQFSKDLMDSERPDGLDELALGSSGEEAVCQQHQPYLLTRTFCSCCLHGDGFECLQIDSGSRCRYEGSSYSRSSR